MKKNISGKKAFNVVGGSRKREMKNSTFTILVVVLLALIAAFTFMGGKKSSSAKISGRNSHQVSTNLAKPFDAKATITMKDLKMTADINQTRAGECTVKITEPKTLSGMQFIYNGNDVSVSYKGFTVKLNQDSKLVQTVAGIIVEAINKASSPSGIDISIDGGRLLLQGDSDAGKFKMLLDKENGSIVSLSVPSVDFECNFTDFIFKNA